MTRPQTVQDVLEALSQHRLVEPGRLNALLTCAQLTDVPTTLERLVSDGLLTGFQALEVAHGRVKSLWLGGYRVLDRLGKGAMGSVFLAEQPVLGRRVAVKVLSEALRADPGARKRFVREARAAATLDHPNIVRVFDVNMSNDPPYLVMEFVDGVSLQAAVSQFGTFSTGEAASIGVQVADGLVQAAAVGLVHRDIKPANLLVDRRGAAKILDLGIVRFTHDDTLSRLNATDFILGTLDYLAPEQAENSSKVDPRADLYSLGATLYFLLAGHPPYTIADPRQKLTAKQTVDPPPIHQLRPDVSVEFSDIVARLMARNPADRYATPSLAVAALHSWSVTGMDFPARLFRSKTQSTDHGRQHTSHEPARESAPETLLIIKAGLLRSSPEAGESAAFVPPAALPEPPAAPLSEEAPENLPGYADASPTDVLGVCSAQGTDTQGGGCGASLTDEMAVPPELTEPLDLAALVATPNPPAAPEAAPGADFPPAARESHPTVGPQEERSRGGISLGLVLAAVVVGVVAALIAIFLR